MRTIQVLLVAISLAIAAAGCSKHNPLSCCTTQAQCQMFGLDKVTPCADSTRVCDQSGTCVAPECTTSADCTSSSAPVCVDRLCVAACTQDMDCTGVAGKPYCATDGSCVACTQDTQCTPDAPVCDGTSHACRGCQADPECPGGLCLEADGTCVPEAQAIYVFQVGTDAGTCTKSAPCLTLGYALEQVSATRNVIHLAGSGFGLTSNLMIDKPVYIDGTQTQLTNGSSTGPLLTLAPNLGAPVVLSQLSLMPSSGTAVSGGAGDSLRLFDVTTSGEIDVSSGTIEVNKSSFTGTGMAINCMNGTTTVTSSTFSGPALDSTNCQLTVRNTKFVTDGPTVSAQGGTVTIENNLLIETDALGDSMNVKSVAPGSVVRFNTFVNTAAVESDGTALACDASVTVTSDIFAYGSMHPHGYSPVCPTQYSLYDTVALPQYTGGAGDKVGDSAGFFREHGRDGLPPRREQPRASVRRAWPARERRLRGKRSSEPRRHVTGHGGVRGAVRRVC